MKCLFLNLAITYYGHWLLQNLLNLLENIMFLCLYNILFNVLSYTHV